MNKKMMTKRFFSIVVAVVLATALVIPAIVVSADPATATRTLPTTVDAGDDFVVGIVASGCGAMGQVVETLPTGFSYVSCVSEDVLVTQDDNVVKFTFMSDGVSFVYTVTASTTEGVYTFSGVVKDEDKVPSTIGGDTSITVGAVTPPVATATRTLPATAVDAGANFDVGIVASGCGQMGEVEETLPAGFDYVSCASTDVIVTEEDSIVRFSFMVDGVSFDYTVAASTTEGTYSFSGVVKDENKVPSTIGGDTSITVSPVGPVEVVLERSGSLDKGDRVTLTTISGGATELIITLDAGTTGDIDLELWDSTTHVIGWKAEIDWKGPNGTDTYSGDTFAYSGWDGNDEYITAAGPLSRAYTLKVYGYKAGNYVVTVSYMMPGVDVIPPVIDIIIGGASTVSLGSPVTITLSGTDPSGVRGVACTVWSIFPPPVGWELMAGIPPGMEAAAGGYGSEIIFTFTPPEAGTYTVMAWAQDMLMNFDWDAPEIATFVVE